MKTEDKKPTRTQLAIDNALEALISKIVMIGLAGYDDVIPLLRDDQCNDLKEAWTKSKGAKK